LVVLDVLLIQLVLMWVQLEHIVLLLHVTTFITTTVLLWFQ